ncbi:uncharacterized protein LOC128222560 isoform X1 [Mya arenaria]|uniref:uncharacterized protein LOC128222560 isoform X1 n=1 Tax=Mya arenaria TaxID=6604 RepID=UPI0022E74B58|nr:uncharacterized protein LOC128222560 isoform X1 [Mya arenaria]XP_052787592.1 uncharacterized protein LOC128222560 isoform X1 [Mya arenaria]XP_052787593.1 uncharacterized protein LOC128222560 isoform X1 [Mya arenaria]
MITLVIYLQILTIATASSPHYKSLSENTSSSESSVTHKPILTGIAVNQTIALTCYIYGGSAGSVGWYRNKGRKVISIGYVNNSCETSPPELPFSAKCLCLNITVYSCTLTVDPSMHNGDEWECSIADNGLSIKSNGIRIGGSNVSRTETGKEGHKQEEEGHELEKEKNYSIGCWLGGFFVMLLSGIAIRIAIICFILKKDYCNLRRRLLNDNETDHVPKDDGIPADKQGLMEKHDNEIPETNDAALENGGTHAYDTGETGRLTSLVEYLQNCFQHKPVSREADEASKAFTELCQLHNEDEDNMQDV